MQKIILQPCSSKEARENFNKTINQHISIDNIYRFLNSEERDSVSKNYPDGKIHIWGIKNGKKCVNYKQWETINIGDIVLFSWDGELRCRAIVSIKFENEEIASFLWNDKEFKNLYLLGDIEYINIPYKNFNNTIGYKTNKVVQGFQVLKENQSVLAINSLKLGDTSYRIEVTPQEFEEATTTLAKEENLDTPRVSLQRKEQSFLRNILFGTNREAVCDICGMTYPVEFLVAAHIKKRSLCTLEERKDFYNIVMSACTFGCDALYEKGYILVRDGIFEENKSKYGSPIIKNYLKNIMGRPCSKWNKNTKKYFIAHSKRFENERV